MVDTITIVNRATIPPIHSVEQDGRVHTLGELRDFRWSESLRQFMPDATELSISWVRLDHGEILQPHVHPIQSVMVFYAGSGDMLGDLCRPVAAGDVVAVPAGSKHGFVGGVEGLHALSIQFGKGLYTEPEKPRVAFEDPNRSLASLLAYNEKRLAEFQEKPIFGLLESGVLDDAAKRKAYLDALQIWVDGNQTLLFSRQATTKDPAYETVFFHHLREEMGHDLLHKERTEEEPGKSELKDSVMAAITSWFAYQMYVLDNAEKTAIIHLVIENASAAYHRKAKPALARYMNTQYFDVHVEADSGHAAMGEALLRTEAPRTYDRLTAIIGEAWDMIGAMTDRVVELTLSAR